MLLIPDRGRFLVLTVAEHAGAPSVQYDEALGPGWAGSEAHALSEGRWRSASLRRAGAVETPISQF